MAVGAVGAALELVVGLAVALGVAVLFPLLLSNRLARALADRKPRTCRIHGGSLFLVNGAARGLAAGLWPGRTLAALTEAGDWPLFGRGSDPEAADAVGKPLAFPLDELVVPRVDDPCAALPLLDGLVDRLVPWSWRVALSPAGAYGSWTQGVAADSPQAWWVDGPWSLVEVEAASPPWTLRVHGGSGNLTTVSMAAGSSTAAWVYTPVTPEQSSSGTYSGGAPADGVLDAPMIATVWAMVFGLERATAQHVGPGAAADLDALLAGLRMRPSKP